MNNVLLIGAEEVNDASHRMLQAASEMQSVAERLEAAFEQRRRWEEEYLARIEAIVDRELTFYGNAEARQP